MRWVQGPRVLNARVVLQRPPRPRAAVHISEGHLWLNQGGRPGSGSQLGTRITPQTMSLLPHPTHRCITPLGKTQGHHRSMEPPGHPKADMVHLVGNMVTMVHLVGHIEFHLVLHLVVPPKAGMESHLGLHLVVHMGFNMSVAGGGRFSLGQMTSKLPSNGFASESLLSRPHSQNW